MGRHAGSYPAPPTCKNPIVRSLFEQIDARNLRRPYVFEKAGYDTTRTYEYASGKRGMSSQMLVDIAQVIGLKVVLMEIE